MKIRDAIKAIQGKKAGIINRISADHAETLLMPDEKVKTAVVANIRTKRESYPGIVVITDRRVMAVCGLPGIKRATILPLDELENCGEAVSIVSYKVMFSNRKESFSATVDPDVGERLSRYIAEINGVPFDEASDNIQPKRKGGILNPAFLNLHRRNRLHKESAKRREAEKDALRQRNAAVQFDSVTDGKSEVSEENSENTTSSRHQQHIAARLAAELAEENDSI